MRVAVDGAAGSEQPQHDGSTTRSQDLGRLVLAFPAGTDLIPQLLDQLARRI